MRHAAPRPVFLDRTGRRRRIMLVTGVGLATVLASGLVVLVIGLSGGSAWDVPGFPDANDVVNGADVGSTGAPTQTAEPTSSALETAAPAATPEPTSPRRVPTQTPPHPPKPTHP